MISSTDDEDSMGMEHAERPLPVSAFRREHALAKSLRTQAMLLADRADDDGLPQRVADWVSQLPDATTRIKTLACFISHVQGLPGHLGSLAAIEAIAVQIESEFDALAIKSEADPAWMQAWLDDVLCSLLCLDRDLLTLGARRADLDGLRCVFFRLCKQSLQGAVFKDLHGVKGHKVLDRALAFGEHCLGIGLACSPPMNAARYASLMVETGARFKRCMAWTAELRRLLKADRDSFMQVARQVADLPKGLPECALVAFVLGPYTGPKLLQASQEERLLEARMRATHSGDFGSIFLLAYLYRMWDAACQGDRSLMAPAVDDLSELLFKGPAYEGNAKLLKQLRKAVDRQLKPQLDHPELLYLKIHWPPVCQAIARLPAT